jgi:hypothetical protein
MLMRLSPAAQDRLFFEVFGPPKRRYTRRRPVVRHAEPTKVAFYLPEELLRSRELRQLEGARKGGEARKMKFARPGFDNILRGYIERGERPPVEALVEEHGIARSVVYRRIKAIREE